MRAVSRATAACAPLLLFMVHAAGAQVVTVPTFPVGSATFSQHLQDVDVAAAADGSFLVIWGDYDFTVSGRQSHAATRRFAPTGLPLGPAVQVDTSAHVFRPVVSARPDGGYVAAWQWIDGAQREYQFRGQYLDPNGAPTGADFDNTLDMPGWPIPSGTVVALASAPVFLWSENGFWARARDADRERQGGDMKIGEGGYENDVAATADGGLVVVWTGGIGEAPSMARLFGSNGQPRAEKIAVSQLFGNPRVAANPTGGFAVVGSRANADATGYEVWGREFASDGAPLGDEFQVSASAAGVFAEPDVAFDAIGNMYVAWIEYNPDAREILPPRARALGQNGPLGDAIVLDANPAAAIRTIRLADGSLVNVWYWNGVAHANIVRLCTSGAAACGDGVLDPACEQCDAGAGNGSSPDACRSDCRLPRCGDGVVDGGEQCDDGNLASCDGCDEHCRIEAGPVCGDGIRERACGEQCDDGAANSDTAPDACRSDCRLPRCGDGVVDGGEECDDGNQTSCDGCSFDCKLEANLPDGDGNGVPDVCESCAAAAPLCAPQPVAGLTVAEQARFEEGRQKFLESENLATGLGPVFNGFRCAECHSEPTIGGSSARSVTRFGTLAANGYDFDPLTAYGGPVLEEHGIVDGSCTVPGEVVPPEATFVSPRNTPPLFGLGLLDAIPELRIRLLAAKQFATKRDGVVGRINQTEQRMGRFGWKAQTPTLEEFAAQAYVDEIGITNPFHPVENDPQGGAPICDGEPDPEDNGSDIAAFVDFITTLEPPTGAMRGDGVRRVVRRGRSLFRRMKCNLCHTDKYRTSNIYPVAALRNRKVLAYTDLLLHDMGAGLADGIKQGYSSGSEFRTAPLWGIRFTAPYLHDGRAATLPEAIAAHGGEAQHARDRFAALVPLDQDAVVAFLNSL